MRKILKQSLSSFRGRIIFSFILIVLSFFVWTSLYFILSARRDKVKQAFNHATQLHNQTLQNNFHLQNFIVSGYQQPSFYSDSKSSDIEKFITQQEHTNRAIEMLWAESNILSDEVRDMFKALWQRNKAIIDSVRVMRNLYLLRGFKDYGAEGAMRGYAHMLQESGLVKEADIYKLRRHEKDFLLRNDTSYVRKFRELINATLKEYPPDGPAYNALLNYENKFLDLVRFNLQIGVGMEGGIYDSVQREIQSLNADFISAMSSIQEISERIESNFKKVLLVISFLIVGLLVFLTFYLSDILTRDIKRLNEHIFSFIQNRFKESDDKQVLTPSILEVDQLNRQFLLLKKNLSLTITNLEDAYERAKKISEFKSFFLANMSHEIRTPLNGVIGMLQVLKRTDLNQQQKEHLTTMEYSSKHLMELVNMVLDYSKIEAGKMELLVLPFDLKSEVHQISRSFQQIVEEKGLSLEVTTDISDDIDYLGDAVRLHQVIINLLNNAIKFSEHGTIRLRALTVDRKADSQEVLFEVIDEGIGMEKEQIENLFQAFEQGGKGYSRKYGGTGLGLVISQEIVKMMGGMIKVRSAPGKGSAFSFKLKFGTKQRLVDLDLNVLARRSEDVIRVLLAEDNQINQRVLELMMQPWSVELDIVENGKEALEAYMEDSYDLILLDIQMPIIDGYETCKRIKQTMKYRTRRVGVIALTANAFNEDRALAKEAGFDGFISKPVNLKELESVINKCRAMVQSEREDWR
ncbi:MAG: ATP-binding protein [Flavobacteriales bacterium]|jgi:signal transduction histidine kinase/CheY-like chemotaxis protein